MSLLSKLREAREAATRGIWKPCFHLESKEKDESCPCGFAGDVWAKEKDAVLFTMGSIPEPDGSKILPEITDRAEVRANAQFISLSANHILELIEVVEIQHECLKKSEYLVVESECEECGTFSGVKYHIKPVTEALARTKEILGE